MHPVCHRLTIVGLLTLSIGYSARSEPPAGDGKQPPDGTKPVRTDRYGDPLPPGALARMGWVRLRHVGAVHCVAFVPGGNLLASGGADGLIRLWELPTGREVRSWKADPQSVHRLALAPDGRLLASTGHDGAVHVWELTTSKQQQVLAGHRGGVSCLAFSPRGDTLASAGQDQVIRLWDPATGQQQCQLTGHQGVVTSVAFSADGKTLASTGTDQIIRLWEAVTGKEISQLGGHLGIVLHLAFAPDGRLLASAGLDNAVRLWDLATARLLRRFDGRCTAFAPDGKSLAGGGITGIRLWEPATGNEVRRLLASGPTEAMTFSPDGKVLATVGKDDPEIHLWTMPEGKEIRTYDGPRSVIHSLAVSPDGKTLAMGSSDGTAGLWDVTTGEKLHVFRKRGASVLSMALAPNGQMLAAGSTHGEIHLWDVATFKERELNGHKGRVSSLAFSPDGKILASGGPDDSVIHLWNAATGKELRQIRAAGSGHGLCLAFAPDGKALVWTDGGRIVVAEVATGRSIRQSPVAEPIVKIAYSPDGKVVAAPRQRQICLWDSTTGKERWRLQLPVDVRSSFAFSPDGRMLAAGGTDGAVQVVEMSTGQERRRFEGHQSRIAALTFSPDGKTLFSGSEDATVLVWDVTGRVTENKPATVTSRQLEDLWADLARASGPDAYRAVCTLAHEHGQAIRFLNEHIRPVEPVTADRLAQLIRDLDSDKFAVRQKATAELERLGELAEQALQATLERQPGLEVRRRAEQLLGKLHRTGPSFHQNFEHLVEAIPSPEQLRGLRAVEALELAGSPEARRLLDVLAKGAPEARLTKEAKAALARLAKRHVAMP